MPSSRFAMAHSTIIPLLLTAYAGQLETVQNYLANSVWLDGLGTVEVVDALADHVAEELGHACLLAQRLKQLGVCPPGSLVVARNQVLLQPAEDPTDLRHVVTGALAVKRDLIVTYRAIIAAAGGKDPVTAGLAVRILTDAESQRSLFEGFLRFRGEDLSPRNENA